MDEEEVSRLRKLSQSIVANVWFERTVLFLILLNSMLLALSRPFSDCCEPFMIEKDFLVLDYQNLTVNCNSNNKMFSTLTNEVFDIDCCYEKTSLPSYLDCNDHKFSLFLTWSDRVFNSFFTLEILVKIIAKASFFTFIRDYFNALDFFVVCMGWLSEIPGISNVSFLRVFKLLRPIRTLTTIKPLRDVVTAIIKALPALSGVVLLALFVFSLFATIALNLFQNTLTGRCFFFDPFNGHKLTLNEADETPCPLPCSKRNTFNDCLELAGETCLERDSVIINIPNGFTDAEVSVRVLDGTLNDHEDEESFTFRNFSTSGKRVIQVDTFCANTGENQLGSGFTHFDSIFYSFLTIYTSITLEGWVDVKYAVTAVFGRKLFVNVFFTLVVSFCAFFLLELVLAVISDEYDNAKEERQLQAENDEKLNANEKKKIAHLTHENYLVQRRKTVLGKISSSPRLEMFVAVMIGLNTFIMALESNPPILTENAQRSFNVFFTSFFCLELFIKVKGLGFRDYFRDRFNTFDFFIVIVSCLEMFSDFYLQSRTVENPVNAATLLAVKHGFLLEAAQVVNPSKSSNSTFTVLRTFRLLRVFKLARSWKSFRNLLTTIQQGLSDCFYAFVLVLVLMILYSLLGMEIFGNLIHPGKYCNGTVIDDYQTCMKKQPRSTFNTFWSSFILVFQVLTGENWNELLYEGLLSLNGSFVAVLYYLSLNILGNYVVLNLFLAILLARFSEDDEDDDEDLSEQFQQPNFVKKSSKIVPLELSQTEHSAIGKKTNQTYSEQTVAFSRKSSLQVTGEHYLQHFRAKLKKFEARGCFYKGSMTFILLSTLCLIIDEPWLKTCMLNEDLLEDCDYAELIRIMLYWAELIFNIFFLFEVIVKLGAHGAFTQHKGFFRSGWNCLDLFLVILYFTTSLIGKTAATKSLRSLRAFRILRPLRTIQKFKTLKVVINALLKAMPKVLEVGLVCFLFFAIFAIIGIQNYKTGLEECNNPGETTKNGCLRTEYFNVTGRGCSLLPTEWERHQCLLNGFDGCASCVTSEWSSSLPHFNNFPNAFLTVFEIASGEMWPGIMQRTIDINYINSDLGQLNYPHDENQVLTPIYFLATIIVCSFVMINIFVGVMIDNFNQMKTKLDQTQILMTEDQKRWIKLMKDTLHAKPKTIVKLPNTVAGKKVFKFIYQDRAVEVETGINTVIIINTVMLMIIPGTTFQANLLDLLNNMILFIFSLEVLLKFAALEMEYFKDTWNNLNLVFVLLGFLSSFLSLGSLGSIFRILRLFRLVKLLTWSKKLRTIISTFVTSVPSVINVASLYVLLLTIFALLFSKLFAFTKSGEFLNENANFGSFTSSVNTLVRVSTGESFNGIMHDLMIQPPYCRHEMIVTNIYLGTVNGKDVFQVDGGNCGSYIIAPIAMCIFFLASNYIFLSMITAVVLDNFNETMIENNSTITKENIEDFRKVWSKLDPKGSDFIKETDLKEIVRNVKFPLGARAAKSKLSLRKLTNRILQKVKVTSVDGMLGFSDTLLELIRVALGEAALPTDFSMSKLDMKSFKGPETEVLELKKRHSQRLKRNSTKNGLNIEKLNEKEAFDYGQRAATQVLQASIRGYIHRTKFRELVYQSKKQLPPIQEPSSNADTLNSMNEEKRDATT